MLETLIAILLSLGLNFGTNDTNNVLLDSSTNSKLSESSEYQDFLKNLDPKQDSPIIVVPDVDPKQ